MEYTIINNTIDNHIPILAAHLWNLLGTRTRSCGHVIGNFMQTFHHAIRRRLDISNHLQQGCLGSRPDLGLSRALARKHRGAATDKQTFLSFVTISRADV